MRNTWADPISLVLSRGIDVIRILIYDPGPDDFTSTSEAHSSHLSDMRLVLELAQSTGLCTHFKIWSICDSRTIRRLATVRMLPGI